MWTLVEATETMERYTYGRAILDVWQEDGVWWGNAYGVGSHGSHWTEYSSGTKEEVLTDLLAYAKLHETEFPYPVYVDGYGKIMLIINEHTALRIEPYQNYYKLIDYRTRAIRVVEHLNEI